MPAPIITSILNSDTFNSWRVALNTVITRFNSLGDKDNITIDGGTINGTDIGLSDPALGSFTSVEILDTLDLTGATVTADPGSIPATAISEGVMTVQKVNLTQEPADNNDSTTKLYVDNKVQATVNDSIAFAVFFGG